MGRSLIALLLLLFVANRCDGFSFNVDAHGVECFEIAVEVGEPIGLIFEVLRGGSMDIDFEITDPKGSIIFQGKREREGKYDFRAGDAGVYKVCFSNQMSTLTPKTVSAIFNVGEESKAEFVKQDSLDPLEQAVFVLAQGVSDIKQDQKYFKMREIAHRNTSDSTNRRVLLWFIFEACLILALAFWQIFYLRRFFEVKRIV